IERHCSGRGKGPLWLRTAHLTTALEIVRIGSDSHLCPHGELLGVAHQTGEEMTLRVEDLNTAPVPGVFVPGADIHVTIGVYGHIGRIRQRCPLGARATD